MTDVSEKPCLLCLLHPAREGFEICDFCFGFEVDHAGKSLPSVLLEEQPMEDRVKSKYRGKKLKPDKCGHCGKGPKETDFYPSEPYTCKACHKKKAQELKAARKKTYQEIEQSSAVNPLKEKELPEPAEIGSKAPPSPELDEFLEKTFAPRDTVTQHVVLDFSRCPWALAWAKEHSGSNGDISKVILGEIAKKVPPEWLKDYMMRDLG